jgi:hypothetical protein
VEVNRGPNVPFAQQPGSPWRMPFARKELAIGIAGTLCLFFSAFAIPIVGIFISIFTPLPTLLSLYRFGSPWGYWIPGGSAVVSLPLLVYLGVTPNIGYLLGMLFLGFLLAEGMRQHWSLEKTVGISGVAVFCFFSLVFWVTSGGLSGQFLQMLESDLGNSVEGTLQYYESIGFSFDKPGLRQTIQEIIPLFVRILPGMALAFSLLGAWLNVLVAYRFCRVQRLPLPAWRELSQWRAPEMLVWGVIAAGCLVLVPAHPARILGLNLLLVLSIVYLLQGLSIAAFYFDRWKLPRLLRAVFYALVFLQQLATIAIILGGLFDVWLNFRRLPPPGGPSAEADSGSPGNAG